MAELCRCGDPLDAHSGTSVSGLPCRTCATRQLPPQRRCYGWAPPGSVALSYGCTCPGGDQHDPGNAGCRYGQVAAVRPDGRCGCSFSTRPGKELVCAEWERHPGPHQADGVTWPQLFPAHPVDRFPSVRGTRLDPDLDQAIHAATQALCTDASWEGQERLPIILNTSMATLARDAVEAAAPILLQATRDQLATLHAALQDAHYNLTTAKKALSSLRRLKLNGEAKEYADIAHEAVQLADNAAALDVAAAQENPQ